MPHWWDRKLSSLAATVYNARPDLFDEKPQGKPIPLENIDENLLLKRINKAYFFLVCLYYTESKKANKVLMTATEWEPDTMDPTGWYLTEKYDGMRLYWNGTNFYSRQGEKVNVPESIKKDFPLSVSLDGELW